MAPGAGARSLRCNPFAALKNPRNLPGTNPESPRRPHMPKFESKIQVAGPGEVNVGAGWCRAAGIKGKQRVGIASWRWGEPSQSRVEAAPRVQRRPLNGVERAICCRTARLSVPTTVYSSSSLFRILLFVPPLSHPGQMGLAISSTVVLGSRVEQIVVLRIQTM